MIENHVIQCMLPAKTASQPLDMIAWQFTVMLKIESKKHKITINLGRSYFITWQHDNRVPVTITSTIYNIIINSNNSITTTEIVILLTISVITIYNVYKAVFSNLMIKLQFKLPYSTETWLIRSEYSTTFFGKEWR